MKLCVAQTKPYKGDIKKNMETHIKLITLAISQNVDLIIFPELSLTGYEPELIDHLAMTTPDSTIFDPLQVLSDENDITICAGIPTKSDRGFLISMLIFQPNISKTIYAKRYLDPDELLYFIPGDKQLFLTNKGTKIAPAICYESTFKDHIQYAIKQGSKIYAASVLNSEKAMNKASKYMSKMSKQHNMIVLLANFIGESGGYQAAGQSSIWNTNGELVSRLNKTNEGILIFNTESHQIIKQMV